MGRGRPTMRFSNECALTWCASVSDCGWSSVAGESGAKKPFLIVSIDGSEIMPNSLMKRPPRSGYRW